MLTLPAIQLADPRARYQGREVPVPFFALDQERHRAPIHLKLRADDRLHAAPLGLEHEAGNAAEVGGFGEAERGVTELGGASRQGFRRDGAVTEGERGVGPELDERRHRHSPTSCHSPLRASRERRTMPPSPRTQQ